MCNLCRGMGRLTPVLSLPNCTVHALHPPDACQGGGHYLGRARGAPGYFQRSVRGHQAQVSTTYVLYTEMCGVLLFHNRGVGMYLVHSLVLSLAHTPFHR